jgi:small neutral amino acid transporter SnatA (MarC family)
MKISISRLIAGLFFLIAGIILIILAITMSWLMLIYGIPLFLIGLFILLNKNEDKIEKRKDLKERPYNK